MLPGTHGSALQRQVQASSWMDGEFRWMGWSLAGVEKEREQSRPGFSDGKSWVPRRPTAPSTHTVRDDSLSTAPPAANTKTYCLGK